MMIVDLFRPKWKRSKWQVRDDAVRKLTDQAILAKIARTDQDREVRYSAVIRLTDQTLLAEVAKTSKDRSVGEQAVAKLTDQTILAGIARTGQNEDVRGKAVARLTDQTILVEIARTDQNEVVRRQAVKESHYQSLVTVVRGGVGEPYCSRGCYELAGRYISSVMLKGQTGVCGFCQRPVHASMFGTPDCGVIPYEGMTLFFCINCGEVARTYLSNYQKCCMCQKSI